MKATYNKAEILKRAWVLFKNQSVKTDNQFSMCLKRSWEIAKTPYVKPTVEQVYKENYSSVLNYVNYKLINYNVTDRQLAEDLTGETFLKAIVHYDKYDHAKGQINTWLYNIALNTVKDHFNKCQTKRVTNVSRFVDDDDKEIFQFVSDDDTYDIVERNELKTTIYDAIDNLKPKQRKIAILYFIQEKQYEEIAKICSIPMGTVKGTISRCKIALQNELQGTKFEYAIN